MHVTITDPDSPFGSPAYDGPASDAGTVLDSGAYPATTDDGDPVTVTVHDTDGTVTVTPDLGALAAAVIGSDKDHTRGAELDPRNVAWRRLVVATDPGEDEWGDLLPGPATSLVCALPGGPDALTGVWGRPYPVTVDQAMPDHPLVQHLRWEHGWECFDGTFTVEQAARTHAEYDHTGAAAQDRQEVLLHKVTDLSTPTFEQHRPQVEAAAARRVAQARKDERVRQVADDAEAALWRTVAAAYPDAEAGDVDPFTAHALSSAIRDAVATWVRTNTP